MNTSLQKSCVFGNPIEQSKSPIIHSMFAAQFDISLDYSKRFAEADAFKISADAFFNDPQSIGANVTMPFKHDALAWVDKLSEQAKQAGAVNTIIRKGESFIGDNTDGYGLVTDLVEHGVTLNNARILLIGAGGAAQGALPALIDAGINSICIYNRSLKKAATLVKHSNQYQNDIAFIFEADMNDFDIIINATSLSLQKQLPDLPNSIFDGSPAVYDMVYLNAPTVFLEHAKAQGCELTIDGLGMLVHQAARSFYLWFNVKPDTLPVHEHLRQLAKQ